MDPEEETLPSRTTAFGQGSGMSSLDQDSARQNSQVPRQFTPTSVLHQLYLSPNNGNSPTDAQRVLIGGGRLKTSNGESPQSYEAGRFLASKYANI